MSFYDIDLVTIDGKTQKMNVYRGKTLLIDTQDCKRSTTNSRTGASWCSVFPAINSGLQKPSGEAAIEQFCTRNYGVTFPMFAKIEVNGEIAHPLYKYLRAEKPGILGTEAIKWNCTKFLVGSDGMVLKRCAPNQPPLSH
jgi:glutathione peroxidase